MTKFYAFRSKITWNDFDIGISLPFADVT